LYFYFDFQSRYDKIYITRERNFIIVKHIQNEFTNYSAHVKRNWSIKRSCRKNCWRKCKYKTWSLSQQI